VEADDPAFDLPVKPVGPVLSADAVMKEEWDIAATGIGPRRVVASPLPKSILDLAVIHTLVGQGAVVFCGGGGGIPVIRMDDHWVGVPAVIDKDRFSALLATELSADVLLISTAIDSLKTGFSTSSEKSLTEISCADALAGIESGEFPPGSMGPKLSAMVIAKQTITDCEVLMCAPGEALKALRGESGTRLV
jgi:carbamate kinase